jgi:hypothetical protein
MKEYRQKGNELILKECPFCGNQKWNFQINVEKGVYHDWVCGAKGPISRLNILLPGIFNSKIVQDIPITLPVTLMLEECSDVLGTPGETYLRGRGFQLFEFIDWGIKYSKKGKLIFPLYTKEDKLIYYVEKEIVSGRWCYPTGVSKKDIVWARAPFKDNDTILLVEGLMDAIKIYSYGYNVMVLLGTHVFDKDVAYIAERKLKPVLFLDGDCKIEVYKRIQKRLKEFDFIKIENGKDPDELSFTEVETLYNNRRRFNLGSELELSWGR